MSPEPRVRIVVSRSLSNKRKSWNDACTLVYVWERFIGRLAENARDKFMTIAELCVKRAVFPAMLISFLLVLGIFSFRDLGVDLFPKADPGVVSVTVKIPG